MMQPMHNEALLRLVTTLVQQAGERLLKEWQRSNGPRDSGSKAIADDRIEAFLRRELLGLLDCDFWGEETGYDPSGNDYCLAVDPHDGTGDLLLGPPGRAPSVGLLHQGVPVLGVVYAMISSDLGNDCLGWVEGMPHLLRNGQSNVVDLSKSKLTDKSVVWVSAAAMSEPFAHSDLCAPARFVPVASAAYCLARVAAGDGVCGVTLTGFGAQHVVGAHALLGGAKGVLLNEHGMPLTYEDLETVCESCFGGSPEPAAQLATRNWQGVL